MRQKSLIYAAKKLNKQTNEREKKMKNKPARSRQRTEFSTLEKVMDNRSAKHTYELDQLNEQRSELEKLTLKLALKMQF